jgi:hypothetical protein
LGVQRGRGTSFKLYFPPVSEPLPDTTSGLDLAGQRGSETVLVVEDEEAVRDLTAMMLRYLGYNVLTASGSDATIEIGRAHTGTIALW